MKWAYKAIFVGRGEQIEIIKLNKILNLYSEWDLVSVDNGVAYFKRPLNEVIESVNLSLFGNSISDEKE